MSIYVIRAYHWGYNDETYYPCGSNIESTFSSEEDAKKVKLKLEREYWNHIDLGETNQFFDTNEQLINKVNAFTQEKPGKYLFISDDRRGVNIPNSLTDEDYEQFLKTQVSEFNIRIQSRITY